MQNKFLTFPLELKEVDEDDEGMGVIRGYASTFGNMDYGYDIVDKGAFRKTLSDSGGRIPILADHMPTQQIGWNERAIEDEKGLFVEGRLDIINNQKAKERYSLLKQGLKLKCKVGLSIGYMTIKAEPDPKNPSIRRLKELKLYEYSLVTFPMNPEAMVTAAKNWGSETPSVEHAVQLFIEQMKKAGYPESDLFEVLGKFQATAAKPKPEPSVLHLIREQTERFKKTIAG